MRYARQCSPSILMKTLSSIPVYHTRSYSAPQTSPTYTIIEWPIFSPSFQEYLKISKLLTTTKLDE
jgi:hypothetical protein